MFRPCWSTQLWCSLKVSNRRGLFQNCCVVSFRGLSFMHCFIDRLAEKLADFVVGSLKGRRQCRTSYMDTQPYHTNYPIVPLNITTYNNDQVWQCFDIGHTLATYARIASCCMMFLVFAWHVQHFKNIFDCNLTWRVFYCINQRQTIMITITVAFVPLVDCFHQTALLLHLSSS